MSFRPAGEAPGNCGSFALCGDIPPNNAVLTTGRYVDPEWIVSLSSDKITGLVSGGDIELDTTVINGGTDKNVLFQNGTAVGEEASPDTFTYDIATGTLKAPFFVGDGTGLTGLPGGGDALTANPLSQFAASTSAAIGVGTVELGHATDTTISRVSAGVVAIEGVPILTTAAQIAALDFSSLPTSDPGSGKLWLNGGVLQVGA